MFLLFLAKPIIMLAVFFAFTIPPAAKTIAVLVFVYGIVQILKQAPVLKPYIKGWIAIALNALFSLLGLLVVIPPDQLYSWSTIASTITTWLGIVLGAAGVHGTVSSMTDTESSTPSTK